jgi:hypothetical protein
MRCTVSEAWKVWERRVVAHAQEYADMPWKRRLRLGDNHDLLDVDGCLPMGWLVGCKAIRRGVTFGAKISEAMDQCDRALLNVGRPRRQDGNGRVVVDSGGIIPVQIMQRAGYPVGKAYAVTEYDYLLDLARERREYSVFAETLRQAVKGTMTT